MMTHASPARLHELVIEEFLAPVPNGIGVAIFDSWRSQLALLKLLSSAERKENK